MCDGAIHHIRTVGECEGECVRKIMRVEESMCVRVCVRECVCVCVCDLCHGHDFDDGDALFACVLLW